MTKEKIDCLILIRDTADQMLALNNAIEIAKADTVISTVATNKLERAAIKPEEIQQLEAESAKLYSNIISKRLSELEKQLNNLVKSWQSMGK
jgi:hypothetical protein